LAPFDPYPDGAYFSGSLAEDTAGNLFGTTTQGGPGGYGTVFEVAPGSHALTVLASFNNANGAFPLGGVIADAGGNLFGTTEAGGAYGYGTVFEVAQGNQTITPLATFDFGNGALPQSNLAEDAAGNLFGTTEAGGAGGYGTVFEVAQGSNTVTTLAAFNNANGANPYAGVIEDAAGNLFGTTSSGGADGAGTVFEIAGGSNAVTTLASFNYTANGETPTAALVEDAAGDLFGTAQYGGPAGEGTVFEVAKGSGTITTLAAFNGANGAYPCSALFADAAGDLFGTTQAGGAGGYGTVFEVASGSNTITTVAWFDYANGQLPTGLVEDPGGNLFGTTGGGTAAGVGTVFEIPQGSGTVTTIATPVAYGFDSFGSPVADSSGDLFGTTRLGGASGSGTVFEMAQGSDTVTTLASFDGVDAGYPLAGLLRDAAGNLFGTSIRGGPDDDGTVFELPHGSTTITTLAAFNGADGAAPQDGLIEDSSGDLFGTTTGGGPGGNGIIFEVAQNSGTITTLASFDGVSGANPVDTLIADAAGDLFGTALGGGAANVGTVFELAHGSNTITTLASFDGADGTNPIGGLVMDAAGNLFGTTEAGGAGGAGTVFEVAQGSNTVTTLASFDYSTNGSYPYAGLVADASGDLFGTTQQGGPGGYGTVFELAKGSSAISTLASFNNTNGASPLGGLVMDAGGNLYGTTVSGGATTYGTVFEVHRSIDATGASLAPAAEDDPPADVEVATFTHGDGSLPPGAFSATVDWGTSGHDADPGTVTQDGAGTYHVSATRPTYAEDGSYALAVSISGDEVSATVSDTQAVTEAPVNATAASLSTVNEGDPAAGVEVATFTHSGGIEPPADFSATIDWGIDGHHADAGTVTQDGVGTYHVSAIRPVYAEDGAYQAVVNITEESASTSVVDTQVVNESAIAGAGVTLAAANEGDPSAMIGVATFTHANGVEPATDFAATIDWGVTGHHADPGTMSQDGSGTYYVAGTRPVYAEDGSYSVVVTVSEDGTSATVTDAQVVNEPAINANGVSLPPVNPGHPAATLEVATFIHANGVEAPTAFAVTVDWGISGHHADAAAVTQDGSGTYHVAATRPVYAADGTYAVTVTIGDDAASTAVTDTQVVFGRTATRPGAGSVSGSHLPPPPGGLPPQGPGSSAGLELAGATGQASAGTVSGSAESSPARQGSASAPSGVAEMVLGPGSDRLAEEVAPLHALRLQATEAAALDRVFSAFDGT
jgi:uncharacterized repeat protein (TIGR03803 family)